MPDQPDGFQQDIADLARKHYFWWPNHSSIGMEAHCQCGERPRDWSYWADHLAEVLVSELGLTTEWALTSGGGRQTVMSKRAAKDKAQRWPESFGAASRYVTRWQDQ